MHHLLMSVYPEMIRCVLFLSLTCMSNVPNNINFIIIIILRRAGDGLFIPAHFCSDAAL